MRHYFICVAIGLLISLLFFDRTVFSQTPTVQTKPLLLGIHVNHESSWPLQVSADLWRTLNSGIGAKWMDIQQGPNTYDFSKIDKEMQDAAQANLKVMYTPFGVPAFIANSFGYNPDDDGTRDCTCVVNVGTRGCYPPKDMNGDGSGTDATWINFITALATHVHNNHLQNPNGYAEINYWESGNEFIVHPGQWCGSYAQPRQNDAGRESGGETNQSIDDDVDSCHGVVQPAREHRLSDYEGEHRSGTDSRRNGRYY